jgi:hypothetical protein
MSRRLALPITVLALLGARAVAQSPPDSLPHIGARVRVIAPRLGSAWQIGLLNTLQVSSSCYRVLLFTSRGVPQVRDALAPSELKRLQVALRPDGREQSFNPSTRGAAVRGERWREVRLALFEPSTRACQAKADSIARLHR